MAIAGTSVHKSEEALAKERERAEQQRQRVLKRITRLEGELSDLELELQKREATFGTSVVDLDNAAKKNGAAIQDAASEIIRLGATIQVQKETIARLEQGLQDARKSLAGFEESLSRTHWGKAVSEAMFADARNERTRRQVEFEKSTARLRKDIQRVKAQLGRARGYNADVLAAAEPTRSDGTP